MLNPKYIPVYKGSGVTPGSQGQNLGLWGIAKKEVLIVLEG